MRTFRCQSENPQPCQTAIDVVECSHGLPRRKGVRALLKLGDCHRLGGTLVPPPHEGSPGAPTPLSGSAFDSKRTPSDEAPSTSYLIQCRPHRGPAVGLL